MIRNISALLFNKQEKRSASKMRKQIDSKFVELAGEIKVGEKVKMKKSHQVGEVMELRGKKAVVKIGMLPIQVDITDLILVKPKEAEPEKK